MIKNLIGAMRRVLIALAASFIAFAFVAISIAAIFYPSSTFRRVIPLVLVLGWITLLVTELALLMPAVLSARRLGIGRAWTVPFGAFYGVVPLVLLILVFREYEDPATLREYLDRFRAFPAGLVLWLGGFAAGGAASAYVLTPPDSRRRPA